MENMDPPILTVEDAVERSSFFDIPPFVYPKSVGDFAEGIAEAEQKILSTELRSETSAAKMAKVIPKRVFEEYEPPSDLITEKDCDALLIYLPGFKKEQLRVQLTVSGLLKISGERAFGDNKYRRFHKEFKVPSNCDTKHITAKFEGGILHIRQPKLAAPSTAPPQPQPQPEPQPQIPEQHQQIPEKEAPGKGTEEEARGEEKTKEEEEAVKKEKEKIGSEDKEAKYKSVAKVVPRKVVNSGLFRELRKPNNLKKLGVSVLMVLVTGFFISYMFKSFVGGE